jgi:hypothetical protein
LARTPWTPKEDKRLRMLVEACKPIEIVAAELKRSAKAVNSRAYVLALLHSPLKRLAVPSLLSSHWPVWLNVLPISPSRPRQSLNLQPLLRLWQHRPRR